MVNLEGDTRIVFIQNPARIRASRIVSDADCRKRIKQISDLVDLIIPDGRPCGRTVIIQPIHLIGVVDQRKRRQSVRCSEPGDGSVRSAPAQSSPATALSAHHVSDSNHKTIEEEAAHESLSYICTKRQQIWPPAVTNCNPGRSVCCA